MTSMGDLAIVGIGISTAVGLSAPETAASVRAGMSRFGESPFYDRRFLPFTLAALPIDGLSVLAESERAAAHTGRERRMLRLAAEPLRACAAGRPATTPLPPLLLVLPDRPTTRSLDPLAFLSAFARQAPGLFDLRRSEAHVIGRSGGILGLARAAEWIRAGIAPYVIVGGVDTHCDAHVLATLDAEKRVKSDENLDGFIPGEGAGFLLVTSMEQAAVAKLTPLAAYSTTGYGAESGHLYSTEPYRGDGLAHAVAGAVATNKWGTIRTVYSSMNGESHWAKEWGVAFLRSRSAFASDFAMHHPADCFGDLGAAAGPVLLGLAALGIHDRYREAPCLVYASSDRESRAAIVLGRANA